MKIEWDNEEQEAARAALVRMLELHGGSQVTAGRPHSYSVGEATLLRYEAAGECPNDQYASVSCAERNRDQGTDEWCIACSAKIRLGE